MKFRSAFFMALILAAIVLVPGAVADNQTRDTIKKNTLPGQLFSPGYGRLSG
ncbi:MAG: hypothetical protein Q7T80_17220 [Methanoregula sp.]|nr:hypothetical protein [Methanoregula sp.]